MIRLGVAASRKLHPMPEQAVKVAEVAEVAEVATNAVVPANGSDSHVAAAQCEPCLRHAQDRSSCARQHHHKWSWERFKLRVFGIGPGALGRPSSRLIHPRSHFATGFTVFITMLLLYTALVVPVTVGFFWNYDACYRMPTLEIDAVVDAVFIVQIFLSFLTGITLKGVYYDDVSFVAGQYLRGAFWFDIVTSIPVSWIDIVMLAKSCSGDDPNQAVNITGLKFVRVLKPLRVFKMLRVIKVIKILHVFDALEHVFRPPPLLFRVFRVLFGIAFLVHACACVYWLAKEVSNPVEVVEDFMELNGIGRDAPLVQKYILASYFVNTVFTTVGFGDIHATNTTEQVFCVVIMYMGTIVFGVLLSEIESAVSSMRHLPRKRGRVTQSMMNFMNDHDIPHEIQKQVLHWVEFDQNVKYGDELRMSCLNMLPEELRKIVVGQLHHDQLFRIPIFSSISHTHRERLIIDLWDTMRTTTHHKSLPLVCADDIADKLFFIMDGTVRVSLKCGSFVSDLGPGDFFGELALLGDDRTGAEFGMKANYLCQTNVVVRTLSRQDFLDVVSRFPEALVDELARLRQEQVQRILQQEDPVQRSASSPITGARGKAGVSDRVVARWSFLVRKMLWNKRAHALGSKDMWQRAARKITLQNPLAWSMATVDEPAGTVSQAASDVNQAANKLEHWVKSGTKSAARLQGPMGSTKRLEEEGGRAGARKRSAGGAARRRSSTAAAEAIVRSGLNSPIRRLSSGSQASRAGGSSDEESPKAKKEREDTQAMKKRLLAMMPADAPLDGPGCLREIARDVSPPPRSLSPPPRVAQGVEGQLQALQGVIAMQSEMLRAQAETMLEMRQQMAALSRHVMGKEESKGAARPDGSPKIGRVRVLSLSDERPAGDRAGLILDRSDGEEPDASTSVLDRSGC